MTALRILTAVVFLVCGLGIGAVGACVPQTQFDGMEIVRLLMQVIGGTSLILGCLFLIPTARAA